MAAGKRRLLRGAVSVALAWAAWGSSRSPAQIFIGPAGGKIGGAQSEAEGELAENVFLPAERVLLQRLAKAQQLLKEARYGEAVRYLGAILDGPEDYFFQPDKKSQPEIHRSLKAEAQRLIGRMPRKGRELYELQYGARARQMLSEAVGSGDAMGLAEVSRRFFHTQSGYQATLLLGLWNLDHGEPLAGALSMQRLRDAPGGGNPFEPTLSLAMATCWLQAGMSEKARQALVRLKERWGALPVSIAGQQVPLFGGQDEALTWLTGLIGSQRAPEPAEAERWAMFRGNPARNAVTGGGAPLLNMRWRIPAADEPQVEELLGQLRRASLEQGVPPLPGLHPLAIDDVILMRTSRNLLAVDFVTGKRLWEVPVDETLDSTLNQTGSDPFRGAPQLAAALAYRMWDDATYGTMSSDGRYVFSIEDLALPTNTGQRVQAVFIGGPSPRPTGPKPRNRLAAHDIRTGKLEWHLGGPADQFALRLAETFFLGPPLPLMGRLYVLAESKGEIRLMALDGRSGELLWSQQLAMVQRDVLRDPLRRLAGASPSYADGILVCPTSAGALVAVELATRSLLWGYRYGRPLNSGYAGAVVAIQVGQNGAEQPAPGRWLDAPATVVDGHVLVTPVESDSLHCLNLIDGKLLWKCKRQDDLYVACADQEKVVLVGRRQIRAVGLADGKPAWEGRVVALPEGSMPSGRGSFSGERYFVPLSSAEVMAVDLSAGKVVHVSKSRKGIVPGNLICHKERVISQGLEGVETFYELDSARQQVTRQLAQNPDDSAAVSLRGEILLDEGKRAEAVTCFRRAYQLDADPRTRSLLRDALLDGLQLDFAGHRDRTEEIEQLLDDPQQRAMYLRLMATGLHQAGEWSAALDHYLKLVDLDGDHRGMEQVTKSLSVRRDRWIQACLAGLRRDAETDLAAVDAPIERRLQAAVATGQTGPLRQFVDYFGNSPVAGKARRELVPRLRDSGELLEAEMVLWSERQSSEAVAGAAVAELAEMLADSKRPADAAPCYARLKGEFAETICRDGKTGRELFDALPEDSPARRALCRDDGWPTGHVTHTEESSRTARSVSYGRFGVPYEGSPAPFFRETTVRFDQSHRKIMGYDALGNSVWEFPLAEQGRAFTISYNRNFAHGRVCGHLLLLLVGNRIMAVDTLGSADGGKPKLLWSEKLTDPGLDLASLRRFPVRMGNVWVVPQVHAVSYSNQLGLGPVTSRYVCFQRFRRIVAVAPLTGDVLWIRNEIAPGSRLFGDDQYVFALGPNEDEATVLRALDGKLLGKRAVPQAKPTQPVPGGFPQPTNRFPFSQSGFAALGRLTLVWREEADRRVLELFDPWEQRTMWPPRKFSNKAKTCLVGDEAVGVLEPDGHFVLLALPGGHVLVDTKLEPEESLAEIILLRSGEQYLLVTHSPKQAVVANRLPIQPMYGTLYKPISHGRVYAFDLDGKPTWAEPVTIEDQHLLLDQPDRVPVLTFACQTYERKPTNNMRYTVSIVCVDKRSGRKVYDGRIAARSTNTMEIVGDPNKHTVELRMRYNAVTLTFTDEPIPPPSAEEVPRDDQPPEPAKIARGLLQALGKAVGKAPPRSSDSADKPPREPPPPAPPPAPPPVEK